MSKQELREHDEETERGELTASPSSVKYMEKYYSEGRGKDNTLDEAKAKIDKTAKHISPMLKNHIKRGIEIRRSIQSREREGVRYVQTSHKLKSGKFQKVWLDIKGRFTKAPSQ